MRLLRAWKHLLLLKRGGIGMLEGGIVVATPGSCAIECPACPHREIDASADDDDMPDLIDVGDDDDEDAGIGGVNSALGDDELVRNKE